MKLLGAICFILVCSTIYSLNKKRKERTAYISNYCDSDCEKCEEKFGCDYSYLN